MPGFTLPFNLVGWAVWSVLLRTESLVSKLKIVSSNMFGVQEQVQSVTSVSPDEDIVWTQLLLGSIYGMGQVTLFVFKYLF